jgi:hypothetical protein
MRSALVSTDNAANRFIETLSNVRFTLANIDQGLQSPEGVVQTTSVHVIETLSNARFALANIDQALHSPEGVVQMTSAHVIETLLEVQSTLVNAQRLMQGVNLAARGIHAATTGFIFALFVITLTVMISLYIHNGHSQKRNKQKLNQHYLRLHYGGDIDTTSSTYMYLIKFSPRQIYRRMGDTGATDAKVILIGGNAEVESRIWDRRRSDSGLQPLLFPDRRFMFSSITEAMQTVDDHRKPSGAPPEPKPPKTLFVFLLISSQDPSIFGPQHHETFHIPPSLRNHCCEIVGTGFHKIAAHKLSKASTGAEGGRLPKNPPMGTVF